MIGLSVIVLAVVLYLVPTIQEKVNWRAYQLEVYLRSILYPVGQLPTAAPSFTPTVVTYTPSLTPSPSVTLTLTVTPTVVVSSTPLPTPTPIPGHVALPVPQHELQKLNNCGPATMAMYLRLFGWQGTQFTVGNPIRQWYDENVNVEELVYYVQNYAGWLRAIYRVGGDVDLLRRLIAAGFPVMIEKGSRMGAAYPNDDLWAGHYLLLTGYDDAKTVFITQDAEKGNNRLVFFADLDRDWHAFNRVYLIVYTPEKENLLQNLLDRQWDVEINRQYALEVSQKEVAADAKSNFAWFNLGSNLVYFQRYEEAAAAYDTARKLGLPQRMLRYQFGPFAAYFHSRRIQDLFSLTEYALQRTEHSEEAMLWQGWALHLMGKNEDALKLFDKAIKTRPGYGDAEYALRYVRGW